MKTKPAGSRAFTLLEVVVAIGILAVTLIDLISAQLRKLFI